MLTKTLYYASYFFGLVGILSACLSYSVWDLPYNEMGRYYDPIDSIVYHRQTLELYTVVSVVSLVLAALFLVFAILRTRRVLSDQNNVVS